MTRLVLDAGALVAWDRRDRTLAARLEVARRHGLSVHTTAIVVAQAWRDGSRQARLAGLLKSTEIVPVDEDMGRRAGTLLSQAGTSDPIDATVVLIAHDGDRVLTSDVTDIRHLAGVAGRRLDIVPC